MLNLLKKKIEKRQKRKRKRKKDEYLEKRKKFNGISEHNKAQDKWRKKASKESTEMIHCR